MCAAVEKCGGVLIGDVQALIVLLLCVSAAVWHFILGLAAYQSDEALWIRLAPCSGCSIFADPSGLLDGRRHVLIDGPRNGVTRTLIPANMPNAQPSLQFGSGCSGFPTAISLPTRRSPGGEGREWPAWPPSPAWRVGNLDCGGTEQSLSARSA